MGHWIVVRLSMEVSNMQKFFIRIATFFAIVAVIDFSLGKVFHYLQTKSGGRTGAEYYVCETAKEDVLIMGSSRASHHYVPEIISNRLGLSCFNAGQDGNGIILQYGRWLMISERYYPKLLIYDINPSFDLDDNDNMAYVDRLKPFCQNLEVRNYVADLFPIERLKLPSFMYRYNYKFLEIVSDCVQKRDFRAKEGFIPLIGIIREEIVSKDDRFLETDRSTNDHIKLFYLEKLVSDAINHGTKVVFVVSPSWKGTQCSIDELSAVYDIVKKFSIDFYQYIDSDLCESPDLFKDSVHLNEYGARVFTEDLVSRIRL